MLCCAIQQCELAVSIHVFPPSWASLTPHPHPTLLGCHRAPGWATCGMQQLPIGYFTDGLVYVSVLPSQFIPPSPSSTVSTKCLSLHDVSGIHVQMQECTIMFWPGSCTVRWCAEGPDPCLSLWNNTAFIEKLQSQYRVPKYLLTPVPPRVNRIQHRSTFITTRKPKVYVTTNWTPDFIQISFVFPLMSFCSRIQSWAHSYIVWGF